MHRAHVGGGAKRGQHAEAARKSGDHQAVPGGEHLVVEVRPRPFHTRLEQGDPRAVQRIEDVVATPAGRLRDLADRLGDVEQVLAGEFLLRIERRIAGALDSVAPPEQVGRVAEQPADLVVGPQIKRSLGFVGP